MKSAVFVTISTIHSLIDGFIDLLEFSLRGCIAYPDNNVKICLARHVYIYAICIDLAIERLNELQFSDHRESAAGLGLGTRNSIPDLRTAHVKHTEWAQHLVSLTQNRPEFLDEPTQRLFKRISLELSAVSDELTNLSEADNYRCELGGSRRAPGRQPNFEFRAGSKVRDEPTEGRQKLVRIYHALLMATEIPTIEACADLILTFGEMPWQFVTDMARQIWDESRHASIMQARLLELGGHLGLYPIDIDLWNVCANRSLALRIAIHQCYGEWIGVDAAIFVSESLRTAGFEQDAQIWEFVARDEILHVKMGNRWLNFLTSDEIDRVRILKEAEEIRRKNGFGGNLFPFHEWACHAADFSDSEVESFLAKSRGDASIPELWRF